MPDQNNETECFPIDNFNDVVTWRPPLKSWSANVKPLKKRTSFCLDKYPLCRDSVYKVVSEPVPKTLVCHDMKGGYLNDRLVGGHTNLDEFKFVSWPCIDIFVYFSHKFLTIPPLSWINAGHTHGVKVLGTIITEGKDGTLAWEEMCRSRRLLLVLATNLANICKYYGFDGYLLNIENPIPPSEVNGNFMFFIGTLNAALKSVSSENLLIWYDAVTNTGTLRWQNCLNDMNGQFFNACDGIFLNYGWNEELLQTSLICAGERKHDVYVGVDVFGRGVFGGGGFTSCVALELIRKYDLSAAIFAPGWVYENCEEGETPEGRDLFFWNLLSRYLFSYGPCELPFETSFCRGYGLKAFENGLVLKESPWFDQSKISYLPSQLSGIHGLDTDSCLSYYDNDGFSGGGCLLVTQAVKKATEHVDCLLVCDFLSESNKMICIEVYTKPLTESDGCELNLVLRSGKTVSTDESHRLHVLSIIHREELKLNSWYKSVFDLNLETDHLYNISCKLAGNGSPVLLGCIKIYSK